MAMEVRLLTRWGSRLQGDIVSVSDERAKALAEAGFGKIIGAAKQETPVGLKLDATLDAPDELSQVKAKLDALGVSYSPRIGLDKAKAKLAEAMAG